MNRLLEQPASRKNLTWVWLGLAGLFLATFVLRVYRLDAVDLRGDEAYSVVLWTVPPFSDDWMELARKEPHPAGAYTLYWAWNGVVGESVFATRLLSVFGSTLGMAVFIALGRRIFKKWSLAILLAVLWALNPFLLWHAQDARTYGVLSTLTPLCFYLLLRATDKNSENHPFSRRWLPYILIQCLTLYIYYFEVLWLVAQGLYILSLRNRALLQQAIKAWVTVGLLSIPVGLQAYYLLFVSEYQGTAVFADWRALFSRFLPTLLFGDNTISLAAGMVLASILFGGLLVLIVRQKNLHHRLIFLWAIVPPVLLYILSQRSSYFIPRYVVTIAPALLLGIIALTSNLPKIAFRQRYTVTLVVAGVMCLISLHEIRDYFFNDPPKAPDWRGLTIYLKARTTSHDLVISGAADPALEYYYRGPGDLYNIPAGNLNPTDDFAWLTENYAGIYLLASANTNFADTYLREHAQPIYGDTYRGVVQYRNWVVPTEEIEHPLNIQFGDVAILRGYTLLDGAGGGTILLLYWEALRQTDSPYSVLVHVASEVAEPGPPPSAVLDHGIANAVISTTAWKSGGLYRDPVPFPVEVPAGNYTIRIGLYETVSGDKLPIADPANEASYQGRYPIGEVVIRPY